ncbi:transglutaminase family protein [Citricoccus parietis]|uniref:Transglutaminase family protein n=2 Tax=Citricoccus parietis TaxID=592307 RepID=A0ABV6F213_9MICC
MTANGQLFRTVWLPAVLVAVLVLSAAVAVDAAFRAPVTAWLVPAAGPAVVGLGAAAVVRSLGPRMLRPLLAGLLAAGWFWCRQWWPETLMVGLVPQPETLAAIATSTADLRETIWTGTIPVETSAPLLAGVGAVLALTALVTDAIAVGLRCPAIAGLPPLALIAGAAAITAGSTPWPALALAAAAWLGLLAADTGSGASSPSAGAIGVETVSTGGAADAGGRRAAGWDWTAGGRWAAGWGTVAAAGVSVGALIVAQLTLPFLSAGLAPEGQRFILGQGTGPVNPAADLSQELRSGQGYAGITYETDDGLGVYLRTAVVDDVMASPWDANPPQYAGDPTNTSFYPAAAHLAEIEGGDVGDASDVSDGGDAGDAAGTDGTADGGATPSWDLVSLTLDGWTGNWAPLPDQTVAIEPIVGEWGWQVDPTTFSAYRQEASPVEISYQTAVLPLDLTLEELADRAGAVAPQGVYNRWGADPELEGSAVQELAEDLTAGTDNPVEQAVALQDHLLSDEFTYSETAPVEQGYDGSGLELTEQFLEAGAGYCIHFASAMVMMAQSVDIPARVVVGYAPVGAVDGRHRVTADRAHAWPELYIDQVGWVPFEPTQSVGRVPSYAQSEDTAEPTASPDPSVEGQGAFPSPSASEETESPGDDAGPDATARPGTPGAPGVPVGVLLALAGTVLAVMLLLVLPRGLRHRRRQTRLSSGSAPRAWAEVEDTAVDLGLGRKPHESEQAFVSRLTAVASVSDAPAVDVVAGMAGRSPDLEAAADTLVEAITWLRYAPAGAPPPEGAEDVAAAARVIIAGLEDASDPAGRRRARWFPRSLVPESLRR